MGKFYYDEQICALLGIEKSTLDKNISIGKNHPPFIKPGKKRLYPVAETDQWFESFPVSRELANASKDPRVKKTKSVGEGAGY